MVFDCHFIISQDLSPKLTAALELQAVRSCRLFVRELLGFMGEDVQDASLTSTFHLHISTFLHIHLCVMYVNGHLGFD